MTGNLKKDEIAGGGESIRDNRKNEKKRRGGRSREKGKRTTAYQTLLGGV